jgi:hypothetical protein
MKFTDIAHIRLLSQQIAKPTFTKAKDLVAWMGVLQAQDYNMAKWAIGIRLPKATEQMVEAAIHNGDILRTHLLRPTWHFVSADDVYWMLSLSAPKIKAKLKTRHKQLELTDALCNKSNKLIEKALTKNGHLTRKELVAALKAAKFAVDENRSSHLLLWAELDGLICSGHLKDKEPTYALLNEWVPKKKTLNKEESLAELAGRYFNSHAPATLQDFVWWSGLNITEAKQALGLIKDNFQSATIGDKMYWLPQSFSFPVKKQSAVYLLPAFDEYIISYKDRSAILSDKNTKTAISDNGIFWPVIIINGKATGVWKRTIKKDKTIVETTFFTAPPSAIKKSLKKAAEAYGQYLGNSNQVYLSNID